MEKNSGIVYNYTDALWHLVLLCLATFPVIAMFFYIGLIPYVSFSNMLSPPNSMLEYTVVWGSRIVGSSMFVNTPVLLIPFVITVIAKVFRLKLGAASVFNMGLFIWFVVMGLVFIGGVDLLIERSTGEQAFVDSYMA